MDFKVFDLGLVDFKRAECVQKEIFQDVKNGSLESGLIICQHYPVITIGRTGHKKNILLSKKELKDRAIAVYQIQRGGDVTYHGPGQINVYPIFNLNPVRNTESLEGENKISNGANYLKKDIHLFLRYLEGLIINLLSDFGIKGLRYPGLTGVWIEKQKIASIGIGIRNWITFHGLSINIKKNDLDNFGLIRPCGMDIKMTSLETILGKEIKIDLVKERFLRNLVN